MIMLVEKDLLDIDKVSEAIISELKEVLKWTTLTCDWGTVSIEVPYNLSFTSLKTPWGYRYRLFDADGSLIECNPMNRHELDAIIIDLLNKFCRTKWGNRVDGHSTLYEYVPKSKKAFKH